MHNPLARAALLRTRMFKIWQAQRASSIAAGPESAVNPQSKLRTTMSKKKDTKEEEEEVWNVWEPWAPSPSNIAPKDLDYLLLRGLRSLLHITFGSESFITYVGEHG